MDCVCQEKFIDKNNDALHMSLRVLVEESQNAMVKQVFTDPDAKKEKGKLTFISVGNKFKTQLKSLMEKLASTVSNQTICHYS